MAGDSSHKTSEADVTEKSTPSASQASNLTPPPDKLLGAEDVNNTPDPEGIKWFKENSIPIAFLLFIGLLVCLIVHYSSINISVARTKDISDIFKNWIETIAVIVGGGWAIFRFRVGREFKESLIPVVSGKLVVIDNQSYLLINTQIKNVGQSKIEFLPNASTLKLWEYKKIPTANVITVPDQKIAQFDPLEEGDRYIEPNEIIEGTKLISFPNIPDVGLRLELQIISANNNYTWRTACVIEKSSISDSITSEESLHAGDKK